MRNLVCVNWREDQLLELKLLDELSELSALFDCAEHTECLSDRIADLKAQLAVFVKFDAETSLQFDNAHDDLEYQLLTIVEVTVTIDIHVNGQWLDQFAREQIRKEFLLVLETSHVLVDQT